MLSGLSGTINLSMPRARARFTLLVIFTLVIGVIRCMADCAATGCNSPGTGRMPPCHHHRQAPGHETQTPCAPDVLLPDTVQLHAPQASLAGLLMPVIMPVAEPQLMLAGGFWPSTFSLRFKPNRLSSVVLRI